MKRLLLLLFAALPTLLLAQNKSKANGSVALQDEGYIMFLSDSTIVSPVDFTLAGKKPLHYRLTFEGEHTVLLEQNIKGSYVVQDTLFCNFEYWQWMENIPVVSPFRVTDFDADGNHDLVYVESVGGHGDMLTAIYLNNPKQGKLVLLADSNGNSDFLVNPEYDAKKKLLTTYASGGMHGYSNETYKLKNQVAEPLERLEVEFTDESQTVERQYKYKNGEWKLTKTTVTP